MRRYLVNSTSLFWLTTCQNILFLAYTPFCPQLISYFAASFNFAELFHFAIRQFEHLSTQFEDLNTQFEHLITRFEHLNT